MALTWSQPKKLRMMRMMMTLFALLQPQGTAVCTWTSPDGSLFDLTPLQRRQYATVESPIIEPLWTVEGEANTYYLNVCADADKPGLPGTCQSLEDSPAYQVFREQSGNGPCYWLGALKSARWSLLDPKNAAIGVQLTYMNGESWALLRSVREELEAHRRVTYGRIAFSAQP